MLRYLLVSLLITGLVPLTQMAQAKKPMNSKDLSHAIPITSSYLDPVALVGITAISSNPSNGLTKLSYNVEFSKVVTGLTAANFAIIKTGGTNKVVISNVIQNPILKNIWQVTIAVFALSDAGTIQLSMVNANNLSLNLTNHLPFLGDIYKVTQSIYVTTLPVGTINTSSNTVELLGSVKSTIYNLAPVFNYGSSPTLTGATEVNAIPNTVPASAALTQVKSIISGVNPGKYYYRVNVGQLGEILPFEMPYALKQIKAVSPNPNTTNSGLVTFELEFNGVVENVTQANFTLIATGKTGIYSVASISKSTDPLKPNSWFVKISVKDWGVGTLALSMNNIAGISMPQGTAFATSLPLLSEIYTIQPEVTVETLMPVVGSKQTVLKGAVNSLYEFVTAGFEYGDSPTLFQSTKVDATNNAAITPGTGENETQYLQLQDAPGIHYYRATVKNSVGYVQNGKTVSYFVPFMVKEIKPLSTNPNNGTSGRLVFEVIFNTVVSNLTVQNFEFVTLGNFGSASILTVVKSNDPLKPNSWFVLVTLLGQWGDGSLALKLANTNGLTPIIANNPFTGDAYSIIPDLNVETLPVTNLTGNGATLQGAVRSDLEDVTVGFEYGDTPTLADAVLVTATTNGLVTAGTGSKIAEYTFSQVLPGIHYYRVRVTNAGGSIFYGKIRSFTVPNVVKEIKAVSSNPNDGTSGILIYEVTFNGPIANLTTGNFGITKTGNYGQANILTLTKSNDPQKPYTYVVAITQSLWGEGTLTLGLNNTLGITPTIENVPFAGDTYTITPAINVETATITNLSLNGATLQGLVRSAAIDLYVNFDYSDLPTLANGKVVSATVNPIVKAGSGTQISQYPMVENKPGTYYYRVKAYPVGGGALIYGKILSYKIPYSFTGIKTVAANPNNGATPLIFEVQFNGVVNNLTAANLAVVTTGSVAAASITTIVKSSDPLKPNSWFVTVAISQLSKGTVALEMNNANGLSPIITTNLPFVGEAYVISPQVGSQTLLLTNPLSVQKEETPQTDGLISSANNVLTPNGDGANDYLVFSALEKYPSFSIVITNGSGKVVYQQSHYQNQWDGSFNGTPLPTGTYYYVLDFGKGNNKVKGYVSIVNKK